MAGRIGNLVAACPMTAEPVAAAEHHEHGQVPPQEHHEESDGCPQMVQCSAAIPSGGLAPAIAASVAPVNPGTELVLLGVAPSLEPPPPRA